MWRTGLVAPRHVGSSQTRAQIRVPCIGRRILNHCTTREAPHFLLICIIVTSLSENQAIKIKKAPNRWFFLLHSPNNFFYNFAVLLLPCLSSVYYHQHHHSQYCLSNAMFNPHHPPPYKIHTSHSSNAQSSRLRPIMPFWAFPTKGHVDENSEEAG